MHVAFITTIDRMVRFVLNYQNYLNIIIRIVLYDIFRFLVEKLKLDNMATEITSYFSHIIFQDLQKKVCSYYLKAVQPKSSTL